jgi:hypothetical protein
MKGVAAALTNLIDRTTGPMHFRILLQPTMAIILAVIDGWKDAKQGRPPYFWSLVTERPTARR